MKADFKELDIITKYYGDSVAERSLAPLINHIHEGLCVLQALGATGVAKRAFCIHPLIQNDVPNIDYDGVAYGTLDLATEYKYAANSYLCTPETDYIQNPAKVQKLVGVISFNCKHMLYADKIQNKKDFMLYHYGNHPRSKELYKYFELWIAYLKPQIRIG